MDKENWSLSVELIPKVLTLTGFSQAARKTGLYIPERRIMLDCGNASNFVPDDIFITHGHMDHTCEIPKILIDTGNIHPNIYCPKEINGRIRKVIHSFYCLTKNNNNPKIHNKYKLFGVSKGDRIPIMYNKDKQPTWTVEVIKCCHTVPCIGYGFIELRQKLLPEYAGLSQDELNIIKNQGKKISHVIEYPLFCYMGDTNESVLYSVNNGYMHFNPILEKYKTIIIECTFLDKKHYKNALKDRHMHWTKLEPYIKAHPETRFILIHFSARYSNDYIEKFFANVKYTNIVPFIQTSKINKVSRKRMYDSTFYPDTN